MELRAPYLWHPGFGRHPVQVHGFYDLQPLVHQGGGVHGDFSAHGPIGVFQGVLHCYANQFLRVRLADTNVQVLSGLEGVLEAATISSADTAIAALVGMAGLRPALASIREGKRVCLF